MTDQQIWEVVERTTHRARPAVVKISEFAEILDVSRITAYRMAAAGPANHGVRVIQLLGAMRVPVGEIFRILNGAQESGEMR
ncbi:MAG: DNA-binding protein [Sulfobacillus benefaciens]|uniref:DNA-binding protein n=1 Tax=Sulfobacillus benefaciens TaxID=453960 RepID=A0A2T2WUV6_9FIRM|nr:MAG: DNA-binding protein [Sulfobacillus benefaciens]